MASRIHLEPNLSATDWDYRIWIPAFAPTLTNCATCLARAFVVSTIGAGALWPFSGAMHSLAQEETGGVRTTYYNVQIPEYSIDETVTLGASFVTDYLFLRFVNDQLTVTDCDAWSRACDAVELWQVDGGGTETEILFSGDSLLPASGGPYTWSGTGYDARLNVTTANAYAVAIPLSFNNVGCGPDYESYLNLGYFQAKAGWRWYDSATLTRHGETISVPVIATEPRDDCDCTGGQGTLSGTDSWTVSLNNTGDRIQLIYTAEPKSCLVCYFDVRTGELHCDTLVIDPANHIVYSYEARIVGISIQATTANLKRLRRYVYNRCSDTGILTGPVNEYGPTDTEELVTRCETYVYTRRFEDEEWCGAAPPPYSEIECAPPINCSWERSASITWTEDPGCGGDSYKDPHNIISTNDEYWQAMVNRFGDVYVDRSEFPVPNSGMTRKQVTTSADCSHPRLVEWIAQRKIIVVYQRGSGGVYYRVCTNLNASWSSEVSLFSGSPIKPFVIRDDEGNIYVFAFKYDAGTSGPGKIYMVRMATGETSFSSEVAIKDTTGTALSVADTGYGAWGLPKENARRPLIVLNISGESDVSIWASHNYCKNWQRGV